MAGGGTQASGPDGLGGSIGVWRVGPGRVGRAPQAAWRRSCRRPSRQPSWVSTAKARISRRQLASLGKMRITARNPNGRRSCPAGEVHDHRS